MGRVQPVTNQKMFRAKLRQSCFDRLNESRLLRFQEIRQAPTAQAMIQEVLQEFNNEVTQEDSNWLIELQEELEKELQERGKTRFS